MSDGIDDGGRGESWSRDGKGDLVNDRTGEPFLPSVAEQGAAPEIPEERGHDGLTQAERLQELTRPVPRDWKDARIAALTLERDTLKAKVERLSAPVSDEEIPEHQWREWLHRDKGVPWRMGPSASSAHPEFEQMLNEGWEIVTVSNSFTLLHRIAARASAPPAHPINDDEQRRKDAGWNDRVKARCACGEMIAWYSGEYLHVAGRSGSCADGRLASPAHFLVGMPPAEPEWHVCCGTFQAPDPASHGVTILRGPLKLKHGPDCKGCQDFADEVRRIQAKHPTTAPLP